MESSSNGNRKLEDVAITPPPQDYDYMGFISAFKMHDLALSLSQNEFSITASIFLDISWNTKMIRLPNYVCKVTKFPNSILSERPALDVYT